jgi:fumarate reductase subunit D
MTSLGVMATRRARLGAVAALVHRLSGLALALFLPLHFLSLGLALEREAFDTFIRWTDQSWVKVSEALLVAAFAVHMAGGLRILAIEFLGLMATHAGWIAAAFAVGLGFGLMFLLNAFV